MSRPVYNPLIENANPSKNIGQKRNVTEIASNEILSISEHSQLTKMQNLDGYRRQMQSHRNGIQMSNCSKWKRTMVEFPSCDMKEHNGTTPDTHTLTQQNKWLRGTDAQIMQTFDTVHNKSKHVPCLALRSVSTFQCILSAHILKAKTNQELCHLQITTTTTIQSHSLPTAIQTVRSSHEQHRPSRLPKELFLLFLPHFKLGFKNHTEYTMVCPIAILGP